jgi:hypothetical protein
MCVIEFKTTGADSSKAKKAVLTIEDMYDDPLQVCAYAAANNIMPGRSVEVSLSLSCLTHSSM